MLLAKETKLLQTIDRLKQAAAPLVRAERTAKQLAAMEAPRRWQLADGPALEVATPATLRAGELAGTYRALVAADGASLDARLAALLAVKYHAKAYDCRQERMTAASCWGMCLGCICVGLHDAWARKVSGNPGQRSNLAYELLPCWLPAA